jgi:hypothetical protein
LILINELPRPHGTVSCWVERDGALATFNTATNGLVALEERLREWKAWLLEINSAELEAIRD